MKSKLILTILCILATLYLQFGQTPYVNHVITNSTADGYEAILTITMNKLVLLCPEDTKQDLIRRIYSNDFKNMQFSYDLMGYPQKISVTVYANKLSKYLEIPAFHFSYCQ